MILLEVLGDPAFHLSQDLMQINGFFLSFLVPGSKRKDPLPTLSDAFEYTGNFNPKKTIKNKYFLKVTRINRCDDGRDETENLPTSSTLSQPPAANLKSRVFIISQDSPALETVFPKTNLDFSERGELIEFWS